jgi:uncharacterized membrane protein
MKSSNRLVRWSALLAGLLTAGSLGIAKAQTQVPQTLVFGVYDNETAAKDAFQAMRDSQREGVIHIDSFAVVSKDQKGRVRVQSTQRRGARAGAVIGALVGVLGGPATALVGAGAGGAIGYLTGNAVGIPREAIDNIKSSLKPGTSAIVAVVEERWVADVERSMREAHAKQVLDQKMSGAGETTPDTGANPPSNAPEQAPPSNAPQQNQ